MNNTLTAIYCETEELPPDNNFDTLNFYNGEKTPPEIKTRVSATWNKHSLFIYFNGRFSQIRTAPQDTPVEKSGKTLNLWELSDVFEVFISQEGNHIYKEFQVSPDGRFIDIAIDASGKRRKSDFSWESGITVKSEVINENMTWNSVMKIPWSAFNRVSPKDKEIWRGNFFRISKEKEEFFYLSWSPVHKINFHQPELFGNIIFRKQV